MNPLIQLRKVTSVFFVALACFALLPRAQAVVPPPDGGYPNFTTAEGTKALQNLTTGAGNTGIGWYSLFSATTGSFNTAIGAGALLLNTGDENTAIGAAALLSNTTGNSNTASGSQALLSNTTGRSNTAIGGKALISNTTGNNNTANGFQALYFNTTGNENTANGYAAIGFNTTGSQNTAIGTAALFSNTIGSLNTATGYQALASNTEGNNNTATGKGALETNTIGGDNTANGFEALANNTTGYQNTADGVEVLLSNTTGERNTANGYHALVGSTTGGRNTAIGFDALVNDTTGGFNTALGVGAGSGVTTVDSVICIGAGVRGANVPNSCFIGQIWNQPGGSQAVYVNSDGKLGALVSSKRFKEEIKPMSYKSEALFALKPVTFRYKKGIDPQGIPQFGLVAEDVEKVNADLVVRDKEGKPYSVRYDQVNAMLLNEFLKEDRKVQEQSREILGQRATITELKQGMETVVAQLKEQAAQIQKVSTKLAAASPFRGGLNVSRFAKGRIGRGGPAPQVVNNP